MAIRAAVFSCVGTAGQRCTTTRRLILDAKIKSDFLTRLRKAFQSILGRIGDPLDDTTLYGPLHNQQAVDNYKVINNYLFNWLIKGISIVLLICTAIFVINVNY